MLKCFKTKYKSTSKKCKIAICLYLLIACVLLMSGVIIFKQREVNLKPPLPFSEDIPLIRYFDKRGFNVSVMPNKTALWTKDIQLCVMFNSVIKTKVIGLLLSYYLQFFNHITLISGTKKFAKPYFIPDSVQVFDCNSYYGWYQQKCLSICLENPGSEGIEGYLYIADDMFINITKMGELDRTKLWTNSMVRYNYTRLIRTSTSELHKVWFWFGFPRYVEYYLHKTIKKLPEKWIQALRTNAGFPDNFETCATADMWYVPTSFASRTTEVISFIVNTTDLFCEVALAMTFGIVTHPSQREVFYNGYLWGKSRTLQNKIAMSEIAHFVHPMKLSNSGDYELWTELMKAQLRRAT